MNEYRYQLEKGSKKHLCPGCDKKRFVRYLDTETGEYLPEQYGRCDRESKCSYNLNPYLNGYAKQIWEQENGIAESTQIAVPKPRYFGTRSTAQIQPEPVYFDFETFKRTLGNYEQNTFVQNLMANVPFPFEAVEVTKVVQLYRLGTVVNGYRSGAVTFPFIDVKNNIRTIQVKQFDKANHTTGTDFLHSIIEKHHTRNNKPLPEWLEAYTKQDKRVSCLFGAHLLSKYPLSPVALVEAPKTAIYGTLYFGFPEQQNNLIWLAVYNKSSFNFDKIKALKGRDVFVFPDLSKDGSTFKEWETKAVAVEKQLPGTKFIFSDLLERYATPQQKEKGADIADVLIQMDWRKFRKQKSEPVYTNPIISVKPIKQPEKKKEKSIFSETIKKGISHKNKNELREFSVTLKKEVSPEKGKAKLLQLARQIIGDNNNETKPDIILQLQNITGVNDTRANNGFNKMLEQKIISWGIEKRYYLTASTPF